MTSAASLYCQSYLTIRKDSGYYYTQSGELRYRGGYGLSVTDMLQWQPKVCWWQPGYIDVTGDSVSRGNFAGYLYSPLIALDRRRNFPDKRILAGEDFKDNPESNSE